MHGRRVWNSISSCAISRRVAYSQRDEHRACKYCIRRTVPAHSSAARSRLALSPHITPSPSTARRTVRGVDACAPPRAGRAATPSPDVSQRVVSRPSPQRDLNETAVGRSAPGGGAREPCRLPARASPVGASCRAAVRVHCARCAAADAAATATVPMRMLLAARAGASAAPRAGCGGPRRAGPPRRPPAAPPLPPPPPHAQAASACSALGTTLSSRASLARHASRTARRPSVPRGLAPT